jgi:integrase
MASIQKRPDGRYRARYRDPLGRERAKHFDRKTDAERWLTSVEHSKMSGAYVDPSAGRVSFRSYAEEWRRTRVNRPNTAISIEQQLRLHVYPVIGDRPLGAIRPTEVQALVRRLGEQLAPSTVAVVFGRVVAVFRAAVHDRIIVSSPCVDIRLPASAPPATLQVLESEQVLSLAEAMPCHYRALVLTGAGTGLRPGELFGLACDRVDFLRGVVRIDQQLQRVRGRGVELGPLKTPSSYRRIPLSQRVAQEVSRHLARWSAHPDLGLVFTNARGAPIQQHPFAVAWRAACGRAGVPPWATPHDLRHYYASVLIRSGASVKVVQTRLGHGSAKTTLDVYGHLFPDEEDRTRLAIDAALECAKNDEEEAFVMELRTGRGPSAADGRKTAGQTSFAS